MTSDPGGRQADAPKPDFRLPEVLDLRVQRVPFEPPRHRNFESALARFGGQEVVEFLVQTATPIPIRALGPALYVGDVAVTEVTQLEPTTYRFVAFSPEALRAGAPITLGWSGQAEDQPPPTRFSYPG